jgi:hypothetical protein
MENDYQLLAEKVLLQAMMDYVRLQHPNSRDRKYLTEAFMDAADMFWDPEYRIGPFTNDDGKPMDVMEFLKLAADRERVDLQGLQKHLKAQSYTHWKPLERDIMTIPDVLTIKAEPWYVEHEETTEYTIDFDERRIFLNKKEHCGQIALLTAVIDILWDDLGVKTSARKRREFAEALYQTLVMNDNFR